VAGCPHDDR